MSRGDTDTRMGGWNGMMPNFMPGLLGGNGAPDPAALAAAYVQLQHQQQSLMAQGMQGGCGRWRGAPGSVDRSGVKKCGHCQSMKPCVEFSQDTSRGDGLRGWCKSCEAEARSTRYKKRKAAAQQAAAARRRFEMPLGSMFWGDQAPAGGLPPFSAPPSQQNMDPQAMQQQLLAMLAYQQQQQQQQMAANRQQGTGASNGNGKHQGSDLNGGSAFHSVGRSGGGDIAAAAFGNGGKGTGGAGSGSGSDGNSPTTSDSETSAMERFKKQRLNASPNGEAAAAWAHPGVVAAQMQQLQQAMAAQQRGQGQGQGMRRGSQDTDDSAAAMALAFGPAVANLRMAPAGLPAINANGLTAAQQAALAQALPQGAPLPYEVHVPKRSRTKYIAIPNLEPVATSAKATKQPEVVQWASRMMATLLLARAAGFVGQPLMMAPATAAPAVPKATAASLPPAAAAPKARAASPAREAQTAEKAEPAEAAAQEPVAAVAAAVAERTKAEAAAGPAAEAAVGLEGVAVAADGGAHQDN